ncbi:MAG: alanine and proline-rich secreted protein Apa, partial [Mycobacterium pseudokansasii]
MHQVDSNTRRRNGLWATLAIATVSSAGALTIALPATSGADPEPAPAPATTTA